MESLCDSSFAYASASVHYTKCSRTPQIGSSAVMSLLKPYLKDVARLMVELEYISTKRKVHRSTKVACFADVGDLFNFIALNDAPSQ